MNSVLVHSCFNANEPFTVGVGTEKIFHYNPNASCSCKNRITFKEREARLAQGSVFVLARKNVNGHAVPEWNEIVLTRKTHGPPWIQLLTAPRIERAYAFMGNSQEAERIEFYGYLTQMCYGELGAEMRARA